MLAWHWVAEDGRLRNGDPLHNGIYRYDGELKMCESGLHASEKPLDALNYAPGSIVCRVECRGDVITDTDKVVCSEREVLWHRDATAELRSFARWCATQVLHLWEAPDVVKQYLESGDKSIKAAAEAAAEAAWTAWTAWTAGVPAARAVGAACAAGTAADRSAGIAWAAASAASAARIASIIRKAWRESMAAARNSQNLELERLLCLLGGR